MVLEVPSVFPAPLTVQILTESSEIIQHLGILVIHGLIVVQIVFAEVVCASGSVRLEFVFESESILAAIAAIFEHNGEFKLLF